MLKALQASALSDDGPGSRRGSPHRNMPDGFLSKQAFFAYMLSKPSVIAAALSSVPQLAPASAPPLDVTHYVKPLPAKAAAAEARFVSPAFSNKTGQDLAYVFLSACRKHQMEAFMQVGPVAM